MIDCQHSWGVVGHSSGPRPILFLQCGHCGAEWRLFPTAEEWGDYLNEMAEAGMSWVARHLGQDDPFLENATPPAGGRAAAGGLPVGGYMAGDTAAESVQEIPTAYHSTRPPFVKGGSRKC